MTLDQYVKLIGFEENPFQHSNADREKERLGKYFINPEYFEDLWGDPNNPVSNIIYAARGCGKTAQRLMIEERAKAYDYLLTITYTDHDLLKFKTVNEINQSYHLEYLNRLLLISFFNKLYTLSNFDYSYEFKFSERQYLYKLCRIYLFKTPASFPKQAINSLKTIEDHLVDLWKKYKVPIADVIKEVSKKRGVEIDLSKVEIDKELLISHKDNFYNLQMFLKRIGITSIYILVDKIDELSLTGNDPLASYQFISTLIKDLELLETPGIGFKFFLWDELKPFCAKDARSDRIFSYSFKWQFEVLIEMINRRISAYSNNKITNFREIFIDEKGLGRIILFSENSPRDSIRICNRILSEQFKTNPNSKVFSLDIINLAIDKFCKEKILEIIPPKFNINYMPRLNLVSFTINDLVTKKMGTSTSIMNDFIKPLQSSGLLKIISQFIDIDDKLIEYAFTDIRLARYACHLLSLNEFVTNKIRDCKNIDCKVFAYRDYDRKEYNCIECGDQLKKRYYVNRSGKIVEYFSEIVEHFSEEDSSDNNFLNRLEK